MAHLLICDDEPGLRSVLKRYALFEGYDVTEAVNGTEAVKYCEKQSFDLIVMDVMMPELDGIQFLKAVRANANTQTLPVFFLTACGGEEDRIGGFELGADDYITKPFSPTELVLRIKRFFERREMERRNKREESKEPVVFGCLMLDEARFKTTVDGEEIPISATEMKLLAEMISLKGKALSRRRILELAWGDMPNVTDRTIDTHVKRLRRKLGKAAVYLETVRGRGYRWAESPDDVND